MIPQKALNAAVDAYYKAKLEHVMREIDGLPYDGSELPEVIRRLKCEGDTARAIVLTSLIEDKIETLISINLYHVSSKSTKERIFSGNGPLSTFSNRILICYHLGWITDSSYSRITSIRKIRNEFAHNAFKVDFKSPSIQKLFPPIIEAMNTFESSVLPIIMSVEENKHLKHPSELNESDQFLCAATLCVGYLLQELLMYPASIRAQVNPSDFEEKLGKRPENVTSAIRNMLLAAASVLED